MFFRKERGASPYLELLTAFDDLPQSQQDDVTIDLTLLWDAFLVRFGEADGLSPRLVKQREDHVRELQQLSDIKRSLAGGRLHDHLAPAMMAEYIRCYTPATTQDTRAEIADSVAPLIEAGRRLHAGGRSQGGPPLTVP